MGIVAQCVLTTRLVSTIAIGAEGMGSAYVPSRRTHPDSATQIWSRQDSLSKSPLFKSPSSSNTPQTPP